MLENFAKQCANLGQRASSTGILKTIYFVIRCRITCALWKYTVFEIPETWCTPLGGNRLALDFCVTVESQFGLFTFQYFGDNFYPHCVEMWKLVWIVVWKTDFCDFNGLVGNSSLDLQVPSWLRPKEQEEECKHLFLWTSQSMEWGHA